MKAALLALLLTTFATSAHAQDWDAAAAAAGSAPGWVFHRFDGGALRLGADLMDMDRSLDLGDARYSADLQSEQVRAYLDFFPSAGVFRITFGAVAGRSRVAGAAMAFDQTMAADAVDADGSAVAMDARWPRVRPYLGFGWGRVPERGLGFSLDVGVTLGSPSARVWATSDLASQGELAAEQQRVRDALQHYATSPTVRFGLAYAF